MPNPATPNMGIVMPTENGDAGTWDETLNAAGERIDEHDHTTGKGLPITPDAISINKDLAMAGNSLTGIDSLDFNTLTGAIGSRVRTLYWTGGDLYARNASGQTIRITNGGALDLSLVGGIGGDYTTTDAEVEYDFTNDRYKFLSDASPETYSKVTAAVAQLVNGVYAMSVVAPTLAGNKTVTLPNPPAERRILCIDSSGAIVANDGADDVTGNVDVTGDVSVSGSLEISGADMIHGSRNRTVSFCDAYFLDEFTQNNIYNHYIDKSGTAIGGAAVNVPIETGKRIRGYSVSIYQTTANTPISVSLILRKAGTSTVVDTVAYSVSGTGWKDLEKSAIFGTTTNGESLHFIIEVGNGSTNYGQIRLESVRVVFDQV